MNYASEPHHTYESYTFKNTKQDTDRLPDTSVNSDYDSVGEEENAPTIINNHYAEIDPDEPTCVIVGETKKEDTNLLSNSYPETVEQSSESESTSSSDDSSSRATTSTSKRTGTYYPNGIQNDYNLSLPISHVSVTLSSVRLPTDSNQEFNGPVDPIMSRNNSTSITYPHRNEVLVHREEPDLSHMKHKEENDESDFLHHEMVTKTMSVKTHQASFIQRKSHFESRISASIDGETE